MEINANITNLSVVRISALSQQVAKALNCLSVRNIFRHSLTLFNATILEKVMVLKGCGGFGETMSASSDILLGSILGFLNELK